MLRPIDERELVQAAAELSGRMVYLHMEVTPGGFVRNLTADLQEMVVRRDHATYRVALRCANDGWVVVEGLTHMAIGEGEPLLLCALVEEDRLTRVLQISEEAFAA